MSTHHGASPCRACVTINGVTLRCEGQPEFVLEAVNQWAGNLGQAPAAAAPLCTMPRAAPQPAGAGSVPVQSLAELVSRIRPRRQRDWVGLVAAYLHFVLGQTRFTRQAMLAHVHTLNHSPTTRRFSNNLSKTLLSMQRQGVLLYDPGAAHYALSFEAARLWYPKLMPAPAKQPLTLVA